MRKLTALVMELSPTDRYCSLPGAHASAALLQSSPRSSTPGTQTKRKSQRSQVDAVRARGVVPISTLQVELVELAVERRHGLRHDVQHGAASGLLTGLDLQAVLVLKHVGVPQLPIPGIRFQSASTTLSVSWRANSRGRGAPSNHGAYGTTAIPGRAGQDDPQVQTQRTSLRRRAPFFTRFQVGWSTVGGLALKMDTGLSSSCIWRGAAPARG